MNRKLLLTAAFVAALAAPLAVNAQQVNPPAQPDTATPTYAPVTPMPPMAPTPASQAGYPASATIGAPDPNASAAPPPAAMAIGGDVTTQVIANAPIPDTKANRARYGRPMSAAGRHTPPAGN